MLVCVIENVSVDLGCLCYFEEVVGKFRFLNVGDVSVNFSFVFSILGGLVIFGWMFVYLMSGSLLLGEEVILNVIVCVWGG